MASKVLFLAIAAFLASQIHANREAKIKGNFDDIIEIIEELFLTVTGMVTSAIEEAEKLTTGLLDDLKRLKEASLELAQNLIKKEMDELNKLIEEAKNHAHGSEVDILDCMEAVENETALIEEKALNSSIYCIDTPTNLFLDDVKKLLDDLDEVQNKLTETEESLEECKKQIIPVDCIKDIIDDVLDIAGTIPGKVQEDGAKLKQDLDELGHTIGECIGDAINELKKDNLLVFDDFIHCLYDK